MTENNCGRNQNGNRPVLTRLSHCVLLALVIQFSCCWAAAEEPRLPVQKSVRVFRDVEYRAGDGSMLGADVFRPADDVTYPIVLMIHGGAWASGDKWNLLNHCHEMAHAGFVAVAINYRLAPIHPYPAQLEDCRAGLRWLVEKSPEWQGDPKRIAVWGYSAGAQLAGMLATNPQPGDPEIWAAALGGAPCDFSFIPDSSRVLVPVMGATRSENPDVYRLASPIEFVNDHVCPTFFFHGTTDIIVPQTSSRAMFDRMQQFDVDCEYCSVEGHGHLVTFFDADARKRAIAFLVKHLPATR